MQIIKMHTLRRARCDRRCIAEDVWLQPLADKFVRLTLQLLARFAAWLSAGMEGRSGAVAAAVPEDSEPAQPSGMVRALLNVDCLHTFLLLYNVRHPELRRKCCIQLTQHSGSSQSSEHNPVTRTIPISSQMLQLMSV